jgi:hypothetical protein
VSERLTKREKKEGRIMRRYIGLCFFLEDIHKMSGEPFFVHIETLAPLCEMGEMTCPVTGEFFPATQYREDANRVSPIDWEYRAVLYERHGHNYPPGGGYRLYEDSEEVWFISTQRAIVRRSANKAFADAGKLLWHRRERYEQEVRRKELERNGVDATIRRSIIKSQITGKRPVCGFF